MSLHERRDLTVLRSADEIAFRMAGNGAVLDFFGPFSIRNGVDDLTLCGARYPASDVSGESGDHATHSRHRTLQASVYFTNR
jgi:hypothetical protein